MNQLRNAVGLSVLLMMAQMAPAALGQNLNVIPKGAKVYVAPMNGYETYLKAALQKKKVPIQIVDQKDQADFEITGASESQKAGKAKKIIMLDWRSREEASIKVADLKSGEIVFAYSVVKSSSTHGKQSSAEACAKHLKEKIESK